MSSHPLRPFRLLQQGPRADRAWLLHSLIAIVLALSTACGSRTPPTATAGEPARAIQGQPVLFLDGGRAVNPFAPLGPRPAAADLAEARKVDELSALVQDGLFDQAREKCTALLAGGSRHPVVLLYQAELTSQAGDDAAAIPWYEQAITVSPRWPEPRVRLAATYLDLQRYANADAIYADIERIVPDSPWGPYGRGIVAARRNDLVGSARWCDTALDRDPEHLPALSLRAHLARQAGDTATESPLLHRLVTLNPDAGWAHARLGVLAITDRRPSDAERHYTRAWDLDRDPATARALADLAQADGDTQAAATWRHRAGIATAP